MTAHKWEDVVRECVALQQGEGTVVDVPELRGDRSIESHANNVRSILGSYRSSRDFTWTVSIVGETLIVKKLGLYPESSQRLNREEEENKKVARILDTDWAQVQKDRDARMTIKELAAKYKVSPATVGKHTKWRDLEDVPAEKTILHGEDKKQPEKPPEEFPGKSMVIDQEPCKIHTVMVYRDHIQICGLSWLQARSLFQEWLDSLERPSRA